MKNIVFVTGTRADFGKIKSLIKITQDAEDDFVVNIFATGMHLQKKYGYTINEIRNSGFKNIYSYINFTQEHSMDQTLAKTIVGLSDYIVDLKPDLIIVHGDRVEALAGSIVGALNNILVAHIEGGELSGTIDDLIRHSVSKLSHIHLVANIEAKKRLIQMGESENTVKIIGSPDMDVMLSDELPSLKDVQAKYDIDFDEFGILLYHPVTTEIDEINQNVENMIQAIIQSNENLIVVYPNNDMGSQIIINQYKKVFKDEKKYKVYPSIGFEYFLTLLKNASFMIGNSSAGVREAPFYGIPSINIGSRQNNRAKAKSILNTNNSVEDIFDAIQNVRSSKIEKHFEFGSGQSDKLFYELLKDDKTWNIAHQKPFNDIY